MNNCNQIAHPKQAWCSIPTMLIKWLLWLWMYNICQAGISTKIDFVPEVKYQHQGWETTYYHQSGQFHAFETDDIGRNCIQTKAIPLRYWQCWESIGSITKCRWRWLTVQKPNSNINTSICCNWFQNVWLPFHQGVGGKHYLLYCTYWQ